MWQGSQGIYASLHLNNNVLVGQLLLVLVSLLLTILVLNDNNLASELLVSTVNESCSSTMIQLIVGGWESHALLLVPCFVSWWLQDTHNPSHPGVEVLPQERHKNAALG
jgi:hypothetical protein